MQLDVLDKNWHRLVSEGKANKKTQLAVLMRVDDNYDVPRMVDEDYFRCSGFFVERRCEEKSFYLDKNPENYELIYSGELYDFYVRFLHKLKLNYKGEVIDISYSECPRCKKYKPECGAGIPAEGKITRYDRWLCYRCDEVMEALNN